MNSSFIGYSFSYIRRRVGLLQHIAEILLGAISLSCILFLMYFILLTTFVFSFTLASLFGKTRLSVSSRWPFYLKSFCTVCDECVYSLKDNK